MVFECCSEEGEGARRGVLGRELLLGVVGEGRW